MDDVEEMKKRLMRYSADKIRFNEPHFSSQLMLREGDRSEVIANLLSPEKLEYSYLNKGRHVLHFRVSNNRTIILPAVFGKNLYIVTYIMRHRKVFRRT